MLGSSLGRLTPSGEAEANTWPYEPTVANTRRNVNLIALMDIAWFDISCGSDCDTSFQEGHTVWPKVVDGAQKPSRWQRVSGRRRPVVDVAIWHGWGGVCAWNRLSLATAQKSFWLNTTHLLIQRSVAADYIDSRLLAESRVDNGRPVNRLGFYGALVMPYALALPRPAFAKCFEFARSGGRVVLRPRRRRRDTAPPPPASIADAPRHNDVTLGGPISSVRVGLVGKVGAGT